MSSSSFRRRSEDEKAAEDDKKLSPTLKEKVGEEEEISFSDSSFDASNPREKFDGLFNNSASSSEELKNDIGRSYFRYWTMMMLPC